MEWGGRVWTVWICNINEGCVGRLAGEDVNVLNYRKRKQIEIEIDNGLIEARGTISLLIRLIIHSVFETTRLHRITQHPPI